MSRASAPVLRAPAPEPIYPDLADAPVSAEYRLSQCDDIKKLFESERDKRASLYKKYRRAVNVVDAIDTSLMCTGMACGTGGVALLATGVAAPIGVGLGTTAIACNLLGVCSKYVARKLGIKAKKHGTICTLAESKLNTIADHVSAALADGSISAPEFKLIMGEVSKYQHMKAQVRLGAKHSEAGVTMSQIAEDEKNALIALGRNEARNDLIQKLTN